MPPHYPTESDDYELDLEPAEAYELNALGRRLASKKGWWGDDAGEPATRSVIRCVPVDAGAKRWSVRVRDAIGLITVGDVQLCILPKIPLPHLIHLMSRSGELPSIDEQETSALTGLSLWDLVADWYLRAMQALLRRDLIRDYRPERALLAVVRGRVHPLETMRAVHAGRVAIDCEYEEFDPDNALNRVLRAAAQRIAQSPPRMWVATKPEDIAARRRSALRVLAHMEGVGDLRPSDSSVQTDLRTSYYFDALVLARHILRGIEFDFGRATSRAFLIRTPRLVEKGILAVLQRGLGPDWNVQAGRRQLEGSSATINPDLVFGGAAIGDVKYKVAGEDWDRADMYQVTTFAEGFRSRAGAVVTFRSPTRAFAARPIRIGDIDLLRIAWDASEARPASEAADALVDDVRTWLAEVARKGDVRAN